MADVTPEECLAFTKATDGTLRSATPNRVAHPTLRRDTAITNGSCVWEMRRRIPLPP